MFFIVTTGRSGSTSIARTLDRLEGCHAVHEPQPELTREAAGFRWGTVSREELEAVLKATRHPRVGQDTYCESNQNLALIIPVLAERYPEARFVWLIRNGLDVVASTLQKQWYTGHSENHDRYEDCTPLEKSWIDWRMRGDRVGEMPEAEWEALPRFDKCCWYWGYVNRVIEQDLNAHAAGRFFVLRLEDAGERLPDLVRWMGFEPDGSEALSMDNPARRSPHHWTGWTAKEHAAFDRWCGRAMDHHYPGWRDVVGGEAARIFVAPVIGSLNRQADVAREVGARQAERTKRLEARLKWVEGHWSFKWYRRLRRLTGDRGGGGV
jgi:hypothetical protein